MNSAEIQKMWLESYRRLEEEGEQSRNSMSVPFGLLEIYDGLTEPEKECIHPILAEWLMSDDNKMWYDAKFIVSQRRVRSLKSAVEKAIEKFAVLPGPEARFATEDLRRIARELS